MTEFFYLFFTDKETFIQNFETLLSIIVLSALSFVTLFILIRNLLNFFK